MTLGMPNLRTMGLVVVVALQGVLILWMTSTHNAQLKTQAEAFNGQLVALTETHNAQLKAQKDGFKARLGAKAAELQSK